MLCNIVYSRMIAVEKFADYTFLFLLSLLPFSSPRSGLLFVGLFLVLSDQQKHFVYVVLDLYRNVF